MPKAKPPATGGRQASAPCQPISLFSSQLTGWAHHVLHIWSWFIATPEIARVSERASKTAEQKGREGNRPGRKTLHENYLGGGVISQSGRSQRGWGGDYKHRHYKLHCPPWVFRVLMIKARSKRILQGLGLTNFLQRHLSTGNPGSTRGRLYSRWDVRTWRQMEVRHW